MSVLKQKWAKNSKMATIDQRDTRPEDAISSPSNICPVRLRVAL